MDISSQGLHVSLVSIWCRSLVGTAGAMSAGRVGNDSSASTLERVTDPAARFGARIRARREELGGLSREHIASQGGPAAVTIAKIERGETKTPAAGTLAMLDTGLRWMPGSAAALYHQGADPVPLPPATGVPETILTADPGAPLTATRLVQLTTAARQLDHVADKHRDLSDLDAVRHQVNLVTDRFLRTWLIGLLESTSSERGPGHAPEEPIVGVMLGQYLASPPHPQLEEDDRTDVLYLRWLIGHVGSDDLDRAQEASFQLRWANRTKTR